MDTARLMAWIALDTIVLQRMLALTGTKVTNPGGDVLDGNSTSDSFAQWRL